MRGATGDSCIEDCAIGADELLNEPLGLGGHRNWLAQGDDGISKGFNPLLKVVGF